MGSVSPGAILARQKKSLIPERYVRLLLLLLAAACALASATLLNLMNLTNLTKPVLETNEHSSFTAEENANLIAAAPDLLAALEAIMANMELSGYRHLLASAAIAKAKGA